MNLISRIEELILISIWRLKDRAYGVAILEELSRTTGKKWMTGSIYASLARLLKQEFVIAVEGDPTPERGGRRKIYYEITGRGKKALGDLQQIHAALWEGLPLFERGEKK